MQIASASVFPQRNPPTITNTVNDQTESNVSTQSNEETVTQTDSENNTTSSVFPSRSTPVPITHTRSDEIQEEVASMDFSNELNPEMTFVLRDEERYANEIIPVMQDQYLAMRREQLKKDPESPYLNKEVERVSDYEIPKDEEGFYTEIGEIKLDEEL